MLTESTYGFVDSMLADGAELGANHKEHTMLRSVLLFIIALGIQIRLIQMFHRVHHSLLLLHTITNTISLQVVEDTLRKGCIFVVVVLLVIHTFR